MSEIGRQIVEQIPHLRRYARALLGDRTLVDDLVQECLERAWSRQHLFQPGSDLRAWLFAILHNLHANAARARARRPRLHVLGEELPGAATAPAQDGAVDLANVRRAIAALPEDQRAAVLLIGVEGMRYAQAAEILDIPVGTLMSRLHRGRERLRALMGDGPAHKTEDQP